MNFGGFAAAKIGISGGGAGGEMLADGLCSYNMMSSTGAVLSVPSPPVHSSISQPLFNSSPLSLALPRMENLGEMGMLGEGFDNSVLGRAREDEFDTRSGSENFEAALGDDVNNAGNNKSSKRKKYHRHTQFQIQELEAAFKENPHPDEKARQELSRRLSLEGRQVKFWFQNRRTQMKTQLERHENAILKQENDKLRMENIAMKEAMRSPMCQTCGGPAILGDVPIEQHHLMIENARLKDELNRLGLLAGKFLNKSSPPMCDSKLDIELGNHAIGGLNRMDTTLPLGLDFGNNMPDAFTHISMTGPSMSLMNADANFDKSLFMELALVAMDELIKLAQPDSPLWFQSVEGGGDSLNLEEYNKIFSSCIGIKPSHFVTDATRATGTIIINSIALVETLMDVNQWTEMFPWNIGRALTLDVISPGTAGSKDGAMQLIQAEFQILSSLVPAQQVRFIRFCKQYGEDTWAVVDVSVDTVFHGMRGHPSSVSCRKLPSGCIVQDMPNGCSKVTWIEHTEYDESSVHQLFRPLLRSGLGFGAKKWVTNLQRQCELFTAILSPSGDNPSFPPNGRKSIVKLAQRMTRSFCTGICATVHRWEIIQNSDNIKLTMRKSTGDSGEPPGVILSATTTVWMPMAPQHLLDFLQNEQTREHWDVLSQDGPMQQVLHIPKSRDHGNTISLLRANVPPTNANQRNMLILQDTYTDASGSLMVHAAVDATGMGAVMNGGADSSSLAILPSGFAIMPDCSPNSGSSRPNSSDEGHPGQGGGSGSCSGSLLSVGFQILVSNLPAAKITMESVDTVKSLIGRTLQGIKTGLQFS